MSSQLQTNILEINNKLIEVGNYIEHIENHTDIIPYTIVEYIENVRPNDQEVWIPFDMPFSTANTLEIKFQYSINIANADDRVFQLPEQQYSWWLFGRFQNKFRFSYGTSQWAKDATNMSSQDTNVHTIKANSAFYFDNTSKVTGMNFSFSQNMRFCNCIGCRLFYVKYSNSSGTLLRNLIPVIRKSDNMAGMWDTVSESFFMPDYDYGFIAGPEVI